MSMRVRVSGCERLDTRIFGQFDRMGRLCYDARMAGKKTSGKRRSARASSGGSGRAKLLKRKVVKKKAAARPSPLNLVDPEVAAQYKIYEEALTQFHQQKFHKAKELLEKVIAAPSKELADRARVHLSMCDQRISRQPGRFAAQSPEDHYQHGVAMMNHGRWDEAREHLAARAQTRTEIGLHCLCDGGARLLDGRSGIGDGKFEVGHRAEAREPLPRAQRRRFRIPAGRPALYGIALPRTRGHGRIVYPRVLCAASETQNFIAQAIA